MPIFKLLTIPQNFPCKLYILINTKIASLKAVCYTLVSHWKSMVTFSKLDCLTQNLTH